MIAQNGNPAGLNHLRRFIDYPRRVCAIANEVPKKNIAIGACPRGVGEASSQRLTVAMDIGEERDQHLAIL